MIPKVSSKLMTLETGKTNPGKTFYINYDTGHAIGMVDHKDAVIQTIHQILNVERYKYVIYSWNYGVEFENLFGEPVSYVCSELGRRITEALTQDDRITGVEAFSFDTSKRASVHVTCTVKTIYGNVESEVEVTY